MRLLILSTLLIILAAVSVIASENQPASSSSTPSQTVVQSAPLVAPELPTPAAQTTPTDTVPALTVDTATTISGQIPTGQFPILRLTPDKIEVIRLESDAVNVLVGNAQHLLAVMETPRQVLLVPREPGATHFQVLDTNGKTIMERSVIVAAPKQDYIRVRRSCANKDSGSCEEYSIFYCPDMCHAVNITQKSQASAGANVPGETASTALTPDETTTPSPTTPEMINDQPVDPAAYSNTGTATSKALMVP